jgi:hypothetical protein
MNRKMFVPQLPNYLDVTKPIVYKLDESGKEIKFSTFGKQTPRPVTKHKASGRYYKHIVAQSSKPSSTQNTQHARVVAERARRAETNKKE